MKKWTFSLITAGIIVFLFVVTGSYHIGPPVLQMKTLAMSQRLIPVFYVHPKDRIVAYIDNADDLFALSKELLIGDPALALESALRAEHGMTLVVSELRRLTDTGIIPYSLLFDTFTNQYSLFNGIPNGSADSQQYETIKTFMQRNEDTAKTIYYKNLPPGKPVEH